VFAERKSRVLLKNKTINVFNLTGMKTVNSLSGGRTSSYIAMNYPADIEIFAICCIDDHNAGAGIDKKMIQMANDKLQKYCSHMPEFVATSEDPKILKLMFDLEQELGREIIWVRGMGWEQMMNMKKMIPNLSARFCTTVLKMEPIFEWLYKYTELPVKMRIGYRYDELERANNFNEFFKMAEKSQYQPNSNRWIKRWKEVMWREGEFVLVEDQIIHYQIKKYWDEKPQFIFPDDSNCLNCFWKQPQQLRKNFDTFAPIMYWSVIQEEIRGNQFKKDISMLQASKLPIQLDFMFGGGSGCQAGFCTD